MIAIAIPMKEVFGETSNADDFSYAIRDFVDRFNGAPHPSLIEDEPCILAGKLDDEGVADAWLAATAVYLANKHGQKPPAWTRDNARALSRPWFGASTPALKAILLQESPSSFRVRNLFVSANVLSRA